MNTTGPAIGIDAGGTKTAAVLVERDGTVLARESRLTPAQDEQATLETMVATAKAVATPEATGVGVAAAGMVDLDGVVRYAPNLAWRDEPLAASVGAALGLPGLAENDANAAAWGEFRHGAGRGSSHMLMVSVGTGIGGGIVLGGTLYRGANGFASEIGHVVVDPDGPLCGCGNHGCWEQVASGTALTREGRLAAERHPDSELAKIAGGDAAIVTGAMVTQAARGGDAVSVGILLDVGYRLGVGIAGLVNVLDPDLVVIGGGVSDAGDLLLEPVRDAFRRSVEAPDRRPKVPIVRAALGADSAAIGAAALVFERTGGPAG
ncbi:MAG TPA: ROK family protein [Actinomycetota bacterium]|nr:ROK family protein [Actinomycetota bacterium]